MAKKRTEALLLLRSEHMVKNPDQGIGYFVPSTISKEEWIRIRKEWDTKLKNSGHNDIEQYSANCTGHFSPFFYKTAGSKSRSGSARTEAVQYRPETAEYYRRLGLFFHHAPLRDLFRNKGTRRTNFYIFYHIIRIRKDGGTYQNMVDWLASDAAPPSIRAVKSIYWAYYHTKRIEGIMRAWYAGEGRALLED